MSIRVVLVLPMPNTYLHGACEDIGVASFPPVLEYVFSN